MVEYRIVCANKSEGTPTHHHIIQVGTGANEPQPDRQWTVDAVRAEISQGTRFTRLANPLGGWLRSIVTIALVGARPSRPRATRSPEPTA
jgi:hypothetical protein